MIPEAFGLHVSFCDTLGTGFRRSPGSASTVLFALLVMALSLVFGSGLPCLILLRFHVLVASLAFVAVTLVDHFLPPDKLGHNPT